jgi:hypothetical protein
LVLSGGMSGAFLRWAAIMAAFALVGTLQAWADDGYTLAGSPSAAALVWAELVVVMFALIRLRL